MLNQSFWIHTGPTLTHGEPGKVEGRYDVVVIGGGLTGIAAAYTLAKEGASVALLEADAIMQKASGQNGGQCSTGVAQDFASMAASLGLDKAKRYYTAYSEAVDTVRRFIQQENIECDYRESGKLKLAAKPQHADKIHRTYELIKKEIDTNVAFYDANELKSEIASDKFYAGFLQRNALQLHVGKFGVGLAEAAIRYGAKFFEHAPVTKMSQQNGETLVETPRGTLVAKQVIVATGISQQGPLGWYRRRIVPVGSFMLATEKLDPKLIESLMPHKRSYVTSRNIGNYFRVMGDDRILFGGRARFAMSNPESDAISGEILMRSMIDMFPALDGVKAEYCWGGLVDITQNRLPKAGSHNGMFYSMGYSGHGVQMSVYMGQQLAQMLGGREEANPWRDETWSAIPGYFGKPWFLPFVGAYYRLQDYLH